MPVSIDGLRAALAGRYEIERELGRGGMATVYLARDVQHERPVALKVLHAELGAALGGDRFQREIRLAARLQHPHILGVYDSGFAADRLWFTMPFVEGESLRDRLSRVRQLPVDEAVRITREVALALDYAHRHQVIHRDIKPENILLADGQAMVADFGIARALGASGGENLTGTGVAIGTPGYMSPEQATGDRQLDTRTDIYSLGSVLYEMLAGEPPFTGPTAQAVISRIMTEAPRPLASTRSAVSPALAAVVAKSMAKTPADRFATAADFAKALEATVTGEVPAASRRSRVPMIVTAALVVALAAGYLWRTNRLEAHTTKRIAVLPFENQGAPEDEYFAEGVADEIRSKLAGIPGLEVTARSSSSQYRQAARSIKEIGRDLDVEYVLTGTVQWSKHGGGASRVLVKPELVRVSRGNSPWSQSMDVQLSDVFKVQSDIAGRVVEALDVALGAVVTTRLEQRPTNSVDAYDAFIRAEKITQGHSVYDASVVREAIPVYERAVELDSTFGKAWGILALLLTERNRTNRSIEGTAAAKQAAEAALRHDPTGEYGHLAMGVYARDLEKDYGGAIDHFNAGLAANPNSIDLLGDAARAEESRGNWDAALAHARLAQRLDPRSVIQARVLARILHDTRHFPEARDAEYISLSLAPGNTAAIQQLAITFASMGRLDSIHALIRRSLAVADTTTLMVRFAKFQEMMWVWEPEFWPRFTRLTPKDFDGDRGHWGLKVGGTYRLMGDSVRARAYADSARVTFEALLKDFPDDAQFHELRGRALALGGSREEAIREAELSLKLRETKLDATTGPYVRFQVARILVQAGSYDRALDIIEPLLTTNSCDLTPAWLRIDPSFRPLRGNARFEKLIAGA